MLQIKNLESKIRVFVSDAILFARYVCARILFHFMVMFSNLCKLSNSKAKTIRKVFGRVYNLFWHVTWEI